MKGFIALVFICLSINTYAAEQAEQIFKKLAPSLFQIRLIDNASGEKSSIGSGFQINSQGLIATNYHVISGFARHPNKYRIEYLDHLGNKGALTLKRVDVVNDLALVKREAGANMPYFQLAEGVPHKGEELFSLGNPHDLGMIVVPGTYNGLKKESFNDKIHFTGSVNSGMSGGPVVNQSAEVVGINVATSGNQIGFLVPHDKLVALYQAFKTTDDISIAEQISQQLSKNQQKLIDTMLSSEWQSKQLGQGLIPAVDVPFIRCWGDSNADKTDALILTAVAHCALDENTYISSKFFTGNLEMEFRYMQAKDLNASKFYHLYEQQIRRAGPGNKATKEDVSEYQCHHDIVSPSERNINSKTVFCTRAYKQFPQLFDVLYLSASIDKNQQALISHFTIAGVEESSALAFTRKFMESVSWK
ncbi:S1 family peptidase [Thalassomonas haliotis]|uniref:Trypsin-like peptidase domain-containing protein n=1 Tax=Thalassomonas haliotis TaxID=485448 RepID=A0ABY7VFP6_9GAMM|nr:serine protease [Thalassomonas haliotis]WDE12509.1 trypsin-like peptidase domain-containing protein [Thalassomonas haliotis]